MSATTDVIGATNVGGVVYFEFLGQPTDRISWHYRKDGDANWSEYRNPAAWIETKWVTKSWAAGNPNYTHRFTINGAERFTTEPEALAVGAIEVAIEADRLAVWTTDYNDEFPLVPLEGEAEFCTLGHCTLNLQRWRPMEKY